MTNFDDYKQVLEEIESDLDNIGECYSNLCEAFDRLLCSTENVKENELEIKECIVSGKTYEEFFTNVKQLITEYSGYADTYFEKSADVDAKIKEIKSIKVANVQNENDKIDYKPVDTTIPHSLNENFSYKRPCAFSIGNAKYDAFKWSDMLRKVCDLLVARDAKLFESFTTDTAFQGSSRRLIATSAESLRKAKEIEGLSNVFIETNLSANSVKRLIKRMIEKYDIETESFAIYIERDGSDQANKRRHAYPLGAHVQK